MSTISPSDLRSLGSSVFDSWRLLVLVAELCPRGLASSHQLVVWSVGVAETRRWPRHQPRDQQEVVTRTRAQHPRPQHRWRRNASDWHLFRHLSSYAWYAVVYPSKRSSNMEYFIKSLWSLKFRMLSWIHKCSDPMTSDPLFKEAFNGQLILNWTELFSEMCRSGLQFLLIKNWNIWIKYS